MKRFDVVSVGGATEDVAFTVDDYVLIDNERDPLRQKLVGFEYGSKIGVSDTRLSFGGGAANTAVSFARLGKKTAAIIAVAKDERGERIIKNLKNHSIDCRAIERNIGNSGVSFVLQVKTGEHVLFTHRGVNDKLVIIRSAAKVLKKAKRIYLSSLTGLWKPVLNDIFKNQCPIAWNPGRKQLSAGYSVLKNFLEQTDTLILNKDEALELVLSRRGETKKSAATSYLLKKIYSFGPRLVVITEGVKGAQVFDGKKVYKQSVVKSKVVDTTGVGDAFASAFIASYDTHGDIVKALRCAAKNSASVVSKPGAQHGLLSARQLGL